MSEPLELTGTLNDHRIRIRWEGDVGVLEVEKINPDGPNVPILDNQTYNSLRDLSADLAHALGRDRANEFLDEFDIPKNHPLRTLGTDRTEANPGSELDISDGIDTPSTPQ